MEIVATFVLVVGLMAGVVLAVRRSGGLGRRRELRRQIDELASRQTPSVFDVMMEEAADEGVLDVAGAEGIPVPVLLKVWRRDTAVRERCEPEQLRFAVTGAASPPDATLDDVRLECGTASTDLDATEVEGPPLAEPDDGAAGPSAEAG